MKKNIQAFLGAILIVAFASPSKSEEQIRGFEMENRNGSELIVHRTVLSGETDKTMEAK
jgi:hypothetical protein